MPATNLPPLRLWAPLSDRIHRLTADRDREGLTELLEQLAEVTDEVVAGLVHCDDSVSIL